MRTAAKKVSRRRTESQHYYKYKHKHAPISSESRERANAFVYAVDHATAGEQSACRMKIKCSEPVNDITFGDAVDLWQKVNRFRLKGATNMRYANLIERHIKPELNDVKMSQVTSTFLSDFMSRKLASGRINGSGKLSAPYVRSIMLIIKSVITFAVAEQLCAPIPLNIHMPKIQKKDLKILSASDRSRLESVLLDNMDETALGIYLSLKMGLRIGEVCALQWNDIDTANAVMHIRTTIARVSLETDSGKNKTQLIRDVPKTKASFRDIPIPSNVMHALKTVRENHCSEYVISKTAGFVSPRTFEYRYHRFLAENGFSDINYHALRHTFATHCIEAGVDVKSLSEILGHSSVSITLNTYVHSSIELKREQLKKLDQQKI